jgi:plastocyanin
MKKQLLFGLLMVAFGAGCASAPAPEPQPLPTDTTVQQSVTVSSTEPATATTTAPAVKPASSPAKTTTTKKPATKPAPGPTVYTVLMQNMMYVPQVIAVKAGDAVLWVNKDTVNHTTVSDGALIWDSGNIAPGQSYKRVFSSVGTYNYHCGVHGSMKGTVVVR